MRVWDFGAGQLREAGGAGGESDAYGDALGWERHRRIPVPAWHPERAELLIAGEEGVLRWTPEGVCDADGIPDGAEYQNLAFSPDGRTLWASPPAAAEDDSYEQSDAVDLDTGAVVAGPWWDTGVAEHPGGGLVLTFSSDQGATHGLFARVQHGPDSAGTPLRVLQRALILDCDGYEKPVFSADGRRFAIRGNAYDNSVDVFAFPSLERVLSTTLGDPSPGYPYPPEWLERMHAWSRHNLAFGSDPGVLWVGTPKGTLVALDLDSQEGEEHKVLDGSPVTALTATAAGELLVATAAGELALLSAPGRTADPDTAKSAVAAFLDSTSEIPEDAYEADALEEHLVVTDGFRTWSAADLDAADSATDADPSWLQIQVAVNSLRDQEP
ncbi:hypothetical protein BN159_3451 [Streptomyces davaonensis JCM 4913]|uniref:WD40 repeat domain-containing protein n=1 Tax=Streptomyces davaonensis (strain DSM 101723 / JCM 4913 / KCC S-0913 / 768) TaxID=1214101 RepID=K4R446_STRDJ|nr:hypothetical protein BN159_3451 [Streptomyces davaonensis JCM 4913]